MQFDYRREKYIKARVCGIECDFNDMRIDRTIVPKSRYQYEVADDNESWGDSSRVGIVMREAVLLTYCFGLY